MVYYERGIFGENGYAHAIALQPAFRKGSSAICSQNNPIQVEGLNGHPFFIAWWNAILGNEDEAVYWLEKVMDEKRIPYHYFNLIATNPDFRILHENPRFLKITDEIGLTPYFHPKRK